jgi:pSer/pThr/pTyr-binding forkhead associated (FHA) protein
MQAKLFVVGGNIEESEISLNLPAIIGRSRGADIRLTHPLVSRHHCEIRQAENCLTVRDLGSMNGTFVGNARVSKSVLRSGDLLTVGTVTFRVVYESDSDDGADDANSDAEKAWGTATPNADETAFPVRVHHAAEGEEPKTEPQEAEQTLKRSR